MTAPTRAPVSAIVTTFNEEDNIADCLATLDWCDEIVVCDSYSTDRTPEIVRANPKVRFFQHTYYGGGNQKNWIIPQAKYEWVLIFDADERCPPALRAEIEAALGDPQCEAYTIKRDLWFFGRRVRYSGFQNDRVVRLFKRDEGRYKDVRVHDRVFTRGDRPALEHAPVFETAMEHYMADDLYEYAQRITKYAWWGAAQAWVDGKRAPLWRAVVRGLWRFKKSYLIKGGIRDGWPGLVFCALQGYSTFMKWALLWNFELDARRGREPKLPAFGEKGSAATADDEIVPRKRALPDRERV